MQRKKSAVSKQLPLPIGEWEDRIAPHFAVHYPKHHSMNTNTHLQSRKSRGRRAKIKYMRKHSPRGGEGIFHLGFFIQMGKGVGGSTK